MSQIIFVTLRGKPHDMTTAERMIKMEKLNMINTALSHESENWFLCYADFFKEVRSQIPDLPKKISIADCTLRDGEQQAGVVFNREDKVEIAKQLDALGVAEMEVGTPASTESDTLAARDIVKLGLRAKASGLCRAKKEDVDLFADIGLPVANISLPIGDLQRKYKLAWDDDRWIKTCFDICEYAKSKGMFVNLSPYDTTRCEIEFLDKVLNLARTTGVVDRFRLVDTVGSATPPAIKYMVRHMKSILGPIPIEVHCHDEFGMAMGTTVAAVEAGAEVVSTTINGVGSRAGNCATEEIALAMQVLYGVDAGVDLTKLKETCDLVARLSGVPIHNHKSVAGRNIFAIEAGMTVAGVLKNHWTVESYEPALVGQKRSIVLGKKSGKASVEHQLQEMGREYTPEQVQELLKMVKDLSVEKKRCVEDEEFEAMVKQVLG